ncbi:hypothetical protein [Labrenzia sp. DG1229]|uniref:hypothetical protein n=1 Tax=Labrenzia sp. DG1229 TaxID=681847 RepID=UPI00068D5423|nr:hypothetical protein [Labrenzia sp. DG1229]
MKHACQNSLQDRLSAMFRILPGVAASAMVFSLVFFSPLFDWKDSIAAAAQSGEGGGGGGKSSGGGSNGGGGGGGDTGGRGGGDGSSGGNSGGESDSSNRQKKAPSNSNGNSNESASEKSRSDGLMERIFGGPAFGGDSEPSGGALSRSEEREAIQSGWR